MKFWAGFVDNKIHIRTVDSGLGGWGNSFTEQPALFKTRAEAQKEYQDVRQVEIKEMA